MGNRTVKKRRSPYEIPMSKLREARIRRGLIIEDVSRATGYSWSQIAKSELGTTNRNASKKRTHDSRTDLFWQAMSDFYGIPEEDLREYK